MRKPEHKLTYQVTRAYEEQNILIARVRCLDDGRSNGIEHTAVIMDDSAMALFFNPGITGDQFKFKAYLAKITLRNKQPSVWLLEEAEFIK